MPDILWTQFAQEMLHSGASMAHTISALITAVSGSTYYDQLARFDDKTEVEQTFFVPTLVPRHHRGLLATSIVIAIHLTLLAFCTWAFAFRTKISRLNNAWQTITQLWDPGLHDILAESTLASDEEVRKKMVKTASTVATNPSREYGPYDRVGIVLAADGKSTCIMPRTPQNCGTEDRPEESTSHTPLV